jgi:hypothetical protein
MKKILKSELTPQLVKHQEATLQLLMVQGGSFTLTSAHASASDSIRLSPHKPGSVRPSDHEN